MVAQPERGTEVAAGSDKPAATYWLCDPCHRGARTLIALWEPRCPYCGRKYQPELQRPA